MGSPTTTSSNLLGDNFTYDPYKQVPHPVVVITKIMMMHGVAANSTTTTTTTQTNTNNSNNNQGTNSVNNNSAALKSNKNQNMMQQEQTASPHRDTYRQETLNFGIKLKDTNSVIYSEQQQRKLEMLESRFVPLNPQKVYPFTRFLIE